MCGNVALDRGFELGFGGGAVAPALGLDPLARLQVLVTGEEVLDLLDQEFADVADFLDVVEARVGRDAEYLRVPAAVVGHVEDADRAGLNDDAGVQVEVLQEHQRVQRIAVLAQGVLEVPVVRGVLHGGEEDAVQADAAGLVVDFVLDADPLGISMVTSCFMECSSAIRGCAAHVTPQKALSVPPTIIEDIARGPGIRN